MARLHPLHLSNHVKHNPLPHRCCSRTHPEAGACGHRLLDLLRSPFAAAKRLGSHIGRCAFPRRSHRRSRTLAPRRIGPPCGDIDLLRSRNAGISGCIPGVPAPSQQRGVSGGGPQGVESVVRPEQFSYRAQGRRRSNAAATNAAMTTCIDSPSRAQPGSDDSCQSGMDDSFGHDGGVHNRLPQAGFLADATTPSRVDTARQQRFHAFFPNALSPACQAERVHRQFGLQVGLAAEELPIRVLRPSIDHGFVRGMEGVLQVKQPRLQMRRQSWLGAPRSE